MRTAYVVTIILALFLISACGSKVNDPADEEALKELQAGFDEADNSQNIDWFSSNFWTDDAVSLPPNEMMVSGKEAITAESQESVGLYSSSQLSTPIEEVRSAGDLAVARGTYYWTGTPTASGLSKETSEGKWMATYQRQADGTWKCSQMIWNSDQPAAGATADGADEEALLQMERDWMAAVLNKDRDALDNILADDFVSSDEEGVRNKRKALADAMSSALKIESAEHSNLQPMVFGDTAVVYGMTTVEGTERGKDISGKYRWMDVFEKRDGRWQCVIAYGTEVE